MKRNAIVRIIIFSFIILILVSILLVGLGAGMYTYRVDYQSEAYALGSGEIPANEVKDIEIEWAAGSITIETADTDKISFHESGGKDSDPMVYQQRGDKLIIEFQTGKVVFGFTSAHSKDLVVTVPNDWTCSELSVDAASADLTVNGMNASDVELNMASGDSQFTRCNIYELSMDCASGEVIYDGTLYVLDCDAASGKVSAVFDNIPKSINFDGASADLELTLPSNAGFTVEMEGLSSDFSSEFETVRTNGRYICGDGKCSIEVDGLSGDLTIRKGEATVPNPTIPVP